VANDDLQFAITPNVDISAIEKYLSTVEDKANKAGKKAAAALAESVQGLAAEHEALVQNAVEREKMLNVLKAHKAPLDAIQEVEADILENAQKQLDIQNQLQKALEDSPEVVRARAIAATTDELVRQQEILKRMEALSDPQHVQDRLTLEQQIADVMAKQERIKNAAGPVLELPTALDAYAGHKQSVADLKSQLDPETLKVAVQQNLEMEKLREELAKATEAERKKQNPDKSSDKGLGGLLTSGGPTSTLLGGVLGATQQSTSAGMLGAIGGMAGEALGGPIGAEVGAMLGQAISKTLNAPAQAAIGALNLVGDSLRGLSGALGPIGVGFDLATAGAKGFVGAVSKINPILGEMIGPLAEIPGIFKGITETLTSFAAKASPGQFRLFEMAVEDTQAVIGHTFLPVLELMREGVRLTGDVLANFLPNSSEMREALTEVRSAMSSAAAEIRRALGELGPEVRSQFLGVVRGIGSAVAYLVSKMSELIQPGTEIARMFAEISTMLKDLGINPFVIAMDILKRSLNQVIWFTQTWARGLDNLLEPLRRLGLIRPTAPGDLPRTGDGAAARPARFDSIEGYQQQLQLAAASSGVTTADLPRIADEQLTTLNSILDLLRRGVLSVRILDALTDSDHPTPSLPDSWDIYRNDPITFFRELFR